MRHEWGELLQVEDDAVDARVGQGNIAADGSIRLLERTQRLDGIDEIGPRSVIDDGTALLLNPAGTAPSRRPRDESLPEQTMIEITDGVIAGEIRVGDDEDPAFSSIHPRNYGRASWHRGVGSAREDIGVIGDVEDPCSIDTGTRDASKDIGATRRRG